MLDSAAVRMVQAAGTSLPTSFDDDGVLYGLNLFLMTAFMCLGLTMDAVRLAALTAVVGQPVLWALLGYRVEAASMIAGLSACLMVRIWVSLNARSVTPWAWAVDLTVTAIALLFTAGWIVLQRPAPFYALVSGTGFGALGAGIIAVALAWVKRIQPLAGIDTERS